MRFSPFRKYLSLFPAVSLGFILLPLAEVLASGAEHGEHHASVSDLLPPVVNFVVLAGFLVFKLKEPLKAHFANYAQEIRVITERADSKAKEAQLKLEMLQKKINNSDAECDNIAKQIDHELVNFAQSYHQEMKDKTEKLKSDTVQRLEKEKSDSLQKLQEEFLDQIIAKANNQVQGSAETKNKINQNILKGIRL